MGEGESYPRVVDLAFTRSGSSAIAVVDLAGAAALSADGGRTWRVSHAASSYGALLVNPRDPADVFVFTTGDGAVLRSADAGRTFSRLGSPLGDTSVVSLAIDRADPQTLYAGTPDGFWAYTLPATLGSLPKSGDPSPEVLSILLGLAATLSLVGWRLREITREGRRI